MYNNLNDIKILCILNKNTIYLKNYRPYNLGCINKL